MTSLATECNALRSLDSTHLASAPFASTLSSITLVVYSINMTLTLVAARNQLNCMRVIINNVTGSPSPTVIQCANTATVFFSITRMEYRQGLIVVAQKLRYFCVSCLASIIPLPSNPPNIVYAKQILHNSYDGCV